MPNIASVLKEEVVRIARKTLRAETEGFKKSTAQYRSEIAALKRRITELERQVSRVSKNGSKGNGASSVADRPVRFSAKGLQALRNRLDLSAGAFGTLVGVSPQTIYNWEAGTTRPRDHQVAAIAALRGIGKREALARLQAAK